MPPPPIEPFTFIGARTTPEYSQARRGSLFSGLPLTRSVDVSNCPYWVTLGGTTKSAGTATAAELQLSLLRAVALFWKLYSFSVTVSASVSSSYAELSQSCSVGTLNFVRDGGEPLNPKYRAAEYFFSAPSNRVFERPDELNFWKADGDGGYRTGQSNCYSSADMLHLQIVRMHNGGDFVGYGISNAYTWYKSPLSVSADSSINYRENPYMGTTMYTQHTCHLSKYFFSYITNATVDWAQGDPDSYGFDFDYAYVDIDGIPLLQLTRSRNLISDPSPPGSASVVASLDGFTYF